MIESLSSTTLDYVKSARDLLWSRFLPNITQSAELDDQKDLNCANFLAAEGALLFVEAGTYRIPSPLIHQLLLERVVTVFEYKAQEPDRYRRWY